MQGAREPTVQDGDHDLADLLTRSAQGDQVAFSSLYDATVNRVYGLTMRVLRAHSEAEDVTHESFIEIWRCASRFDPSRGTAHAWIFTIVHRKAVTRVRSATAARQREARYHWLNHAVEYDSTSELVLRSVEGQRVRSAMSRLTLLQQQAIELAYFEGLTHSEVATALRIPVGTAKTRIRDGLHRLRAEWTHAA